ncbi:MAG: DUF2807 domain-containing protein [Sphingomonadales bacterium]|nr:DUF2807 domain-containing protein [Sphingomonadales bacterium]
MSAFRQFARTLAPLAALAVTAMLTACDSAKIQINGEEGKPLSELDLSGEAPHELALLGPDAVKVTEGEKLAITVDAAPEVAELLRFTLKDGTLGVLRKPGTWDNSQTATVRVTMPALREVSMLGSGTIEAAALAPEAKVAILGSGRIDTPRVAARALKVEIAGTGTYHAAGAAENLNLSIAGTGDAELDELKAGKAEVSIAGTGGARFASDGEVKANIAGTGEVHVRGSAKCTVHAIGTGKLVCEPAAKAN